MKRFKTLLITLGASLVMAAATVGLASAQSAAPVNSGNVGSSGIPRTVLRQDEVSAIESVLNTSAANIQSARQHHNLSQLIKEAGLTKQIFVADVKTKLTSELSSQGYSQQQITIALQHRTILSLRRELGVKYHRVHP